MEPCSARVDVDEAESKPIVMARMQPKMRENCCVALHCQFVVQGKKKEGRGKRARMVCLARCGCSRIRSTDPPGEGWNRLHKK